MNKPPVLYAEDEPSDALLMQLAFEDAGVRHPLRVVAHGGEAVAYLRGTGAFTCRKTNPLPCLVLLDLNLPVMPGLEVLRWIRRAGPQFHDLPILIYTSSPLDKDREQAHALGASGYYVKPSSYNETVELVRGIHLKWLTGQLQESSPKAKG
jgi:CheY-like chemotaxis protein